MTTLLESLTALEPSDLEAHSLSIACAEYAHDTDSPAIRAKRFEVAHQLRAWEDAAQYDGIAVPALVALRGAVDVADDGQMRALYLFRGEIDRMGALVAV